MGHRIGIDIGGTFTDFTVLDENGSILLWKEDSTPDEPLRAVTAGLEAIAQRLGPGGVEELLAETKLFVHGTTIATNLLIQRRGPRTALLCTEGFRDVLYYRDGFKPERFDIHLPHPEPLVPRWLRIGISERITADGSVLKPIDEEAVRAAAEKLRAADVGAVAIAFLWSVANPEHERLAAEILAEELPDAHIVCSSDVLAELREWERTSATVLSAYIRPSIADYLQRLEKTLTDARYEKAPLVMQCNGGCSRVSEILSRPVSILSSGPTAAPAAAIRAGAPFDAENLITVDIGGTSCDVCIVRNGQAIVSRTLRVDEQPLGIPGVEVHSIGAGGGSIAWVDDGGALRVGPESAGAVPGPACYGEGGDRPTVTDANLMLGLFSDQAFLGGRKKLDRDLAARALERDVAGPLGLALVESAFGVRRVVTANMVGAIRALSTERGIDPRGFMLVCGGGGGGIHGVDLARSLGIGKVLIPAAAGTLCAFGMTVTDVKHDYVTALHQVTDDLDHQRVEALYEDLERQARERLAQDGFAADEIRLERLVDARYPGQVHELTVTVPPDARGADLAGALVAAFHREHERQYTYAREDLPVELLHWRVQATGVHSPGHETRPVDGGGGSTAEPIGAREVWIGPERSIEARVFYGPDLAPGMAIEGPAIIDSPTTTVLIDAGDRLTATANGDQLVEIAPTVEG